MKRAALAGLGLGFAWGVAARIWMRLVSDHPEFSWEGTLSIVVSFAICGLLLGLVYGARQAHRSAWWRLLAVPTLLVFASPGMILLPAYLVGGWGIRRRGAAGVVGILGVVLSPVAVVVTTADSFASTVYPHPDLVVLLIAGLGSALLSVLLAYGGSVVLGPSPARRPQPVLVHEVSPA